MIKQLSPSLSKYKKWVVNEYNRILEEAHEEKVYQKFFEQNPGLLPGAKSHFPGRFPYNNPSGHGPAGNVLISEPRISGLENKIADFLWLSYDSSAFCPVFIEIETPRKKYFTKDNTPRAEFTQALTQIRDWKSIIDHPTNRLKFYQDYSIPLNLRELNFSPIFVLIYGSSKVEFRDNPELSSKRKQWENSQEYIMSFDRINLDYIERSFITCVVKNGKYHAKYLSPLFKVESLSSNNFNNIIGISEAVENTTFLNQEQKDELLRKLKKHSTKR